MERTQIFDLMSALKLFGMRTAYDDVIAAGIKRQHEPPQIVGDLLKAEMTEKPARSIKYQMTIAKLPLAKDIDDFDFDGTTVNETLVRDLAGGGFVAQQRNVVLVGGTGTGKTHPRDTMQGTELVLKTAKGRESLENFAPPPYRRGHDRNSVRPRFPALVPLICPL
jgi:hypothetical protein